MFLSFRFYIVLAALIVVVGFGYVWPTLYSVGIALLCLFALALVADFVMLYHRRGITAQRICRERFSNGDDNEVSIEMESSYPFPLRLTIIDEAPFIFQRRDIEYHARIGRKDKTSIAYFLRPAKRGAYGFGRIRIFAATLIGLVERRYTCGEPFEVKVYPGYLALRRYEFLAINNRLTEIGIKRIRRAGNNTEFEQIKDYVPGDEYRHINWKASARRHQLMVNQYTDERSQQIVCLIDKGRVMQQAFRGMTLLDYSINASLVLSYIAMYKDDRAGLATFCNDFDTFVPPAKSMGHMQVIQEALYDQRATFGETDYSVLVDSLGHHLNKRSLLVLFTSFNGRVSMERQLPYLRQLNRQHRLLVVFFEDNELKEFVQTEAKTTEDYYQHVIAEKTIQDQRLIVSVLRQQGILGLLTTPERLSVDVINKYLELKAKQQLV